MDELLDLKIEQNMIPPFIHLANYKALINNQYA